MGILCAPSLLFSRPWNLKPAVAWLWKTQSSSGLGADNRKMLFCILLGPPLQSQERGQEVFMIVSVIWELRESGVHHFHETLV